MSDGNRLVDDGPFRNEVFAGYGAPLKVCLAPGTPCKNRVKGRAHSIQNERILKLLSRDGHVVMPETRPCLPKTMEKHGSHRLGFVKVGRNQATTFTGLCKDHDTSLFAPIENDNRLTFTSEQKFLLAYREVLRELHTSMRGARWQSRNATAGRRAGPSYRRDTERLEQLNRRAEEHERTRLAGYKSLYDGIYLEARRHPEAYDVVAHDLIRLPVSDQRLAASSTFFVAIGDRQTGVVLNVLPHEGRHVVLISYHRRHSWFGQRVSAELMGAIGNGRLLAASRLILDHCENLVIAPDWWDSLGEEQHAVVKRRYYSLGAVFAPTTRQDDARLNLFEAVA